MQQGKFTPELVAPCGMNCGICKRYLAYSRGIPAERGKVIHCQGCLHINKNCYVKRGCKKLAKNIIKFCFECDNMPCENLNRLERRYRKQYNMSVVENLKELKFELDSFKWKCLKKYFHFICNFFVTKVAYTTLVGMINLFLWFVSITFYFFCNFFICISKGDAF